MCLLTIALAMVLSFLESQIPAFVAIPGVKVGLANIAVVFALYKLGWKEAAGISLIRVLLISVLFGNFASLFYSLAGAVLSLLGMILLKHSEKFSAVAVSVAGGVLHNVGQILMACILLITEQSGQVDRIDFKGLLKGPVFFLAAHPCKLFVGIHVYEFFLQGGDGDSTLI